MSEKRTTEGLNTEPAERPKFPLAEIFKSFLKFWWLCVALAVIFALVALYRSYVRFTPQYTASVTFTVKTQGSAGAYDMGLTSYSFSYNRSAANQLSTTFPSIIRSNILQEIVCNDLSLPYFPCSLSASSVAGTNLFTITAKGGDPDLTYRVLQSVIKNYPAVAEYVIGNTRLSLLNEPELPTVPSNRYAYRTEVIKYALIGFVIGLLWVVFYAFKRDTVCSRGDVRRKLNQHCLGALPEVIFKKHTKDVDQTISISNPLIGSDYLESMRSFRNNILNRLGDSKVILITSTAPNEGKTTVSSNLASSLAKMHRRVLLIDGDLRNPSIGAFFKVSESGDFTTNSRGTLFMHRVRLDENDSLALFRFSEETGSVWDVLRPAQLDSLFARFRKAYDYIIVDTSPIGITSEPSAFAQYCDTAIMVVKQDAIRTSSVMNSLDTLLSGNVNLLGCVLNGASGGYDGYGYGYRYGSYGRYGYRSAYHYGYGTRGGYGYGESEAKKTKSGSAASR